MDPKPNYWLKNSNCILFLFITLITTLSQDIVKKSYNKSQNVFIKGIKSNKKFSKAAKPKYVS